MLVRTKSCGHTGRHLPIDGFHQVDLQLCIAAHTCPHLADLADLADHGTTYTRASTTKPSDSFPGLLAQLTGGTSKSTGVYYDDSYDRTLFAPAAISSGPCTSGPGAETQYAENLGVNKHSIDSGVNASLTGLNSAVGIDPNQLPARLVDVRSRQKVAHFPRSDRPRRARLKYYFLRG